MARDVDQAAIHTSRAMNDVKTLGRKIMEFMDGRSAQLRWRGIE